MTSNPFINTTSGLQPNAGIVGEPGAITASSTTSQSVGLGTKVFQVPAQAAWAPGMVVSAIDSANTANYMWGTVVSYSGTTLTLNIQGTGGSGTYATWLINLSGVGGGATGPAGPPGPAGTNGTNAGPVFGGCQGLAIFNKVGSLSTKINILATLAIMANSVGASVLASNPAVVVDLTAGTSTSTANGMDGEARGTSNWIYLYLISNGAVTAGLGTLTSPAAGNPTLPSGYTYSVYVGAMRVDGSGNLFRTLQQKNRTHYFITAASNTAALPAMANGAAGNVTVPTWVGVVISSFVPGTASVIYLSANGDVGGTGVAVIVAPNNAYGNATSANPPPVAAGTGSILGVSGLMIESGNIYWASAGTDGYLFCVGWDDLYVVA